MGDSATHCVMRGLVPQVSGTIHAFMRFLHCGTSTGCAATLRSPSGVRAKIEDYLFGFRYLAWRYLQKLADRSSVHEIRSDEACKRQRTCNDLLVW